MSGETLVCPSCLALNRVPGDRLSDGPKCGKCRTALMPSAPVELNSAALAKMIARSTVPVVVDFWAPWCGPCRAMAPAYAEAARVLSGAAVLAKVDTDTEQEAGARHAIRSIPTLAVFRGGREVARQAGAMPQNAIIDWVRSAIAQG